MANCGTENLSAAVHREKFIKSNVLQGCLPKNHKSPQTSFPAFIKMLENLDLRTILNEPECEEIISPSEYKLSPENSKENFIRDDKDSNKLEVKVSESNGKNRSGSFSKEKLVTNGSFKTVPREVLPKFLVTEFHKHPETDSSTGLLQICCKDKQSVHHIIDNRVREMDKIIMDPATSLFKDIMDNVPELILPGPYKYTVEPKKLSLNSNRYTLDVLGLFIVIIDMIYGSGSVSHVMHGGEKTPLEFTQNVVKIISVMKAAFSTLFEELQKLVMYSTLVSIMKKVPFRWNKCMIYVLEDLIIHPLTRYVNEESIEFKLLTVIVQKRAKVLFKQLELEDCHIPRISLKYKNLLNSHFTTVYSSDIKEILTRSARNSLKLHQVKNVRYLITDEAFIKTLKLVKSSYNKQ